MNTKFCTSCQSSKSESEFSFYNKSLNKRSSKCKTCSKLYHKKHYQLNKDYYRVKGSQSLNKLIEKNQLKVNEIKTKSGCSYCDEHDHSCLDFHHLDPKTKSFSIARGVTSYGIDKVLEEVQKCEIICSNCHRKLHAGRKLTKK